MSAGLIALLIATHALLGAVGFVMGRRRAPRPQALPGPRRPLALPADNHNAVSGLVWGDGDDALRVGAFDGIRFLAECDPETGRVIRIHVDGGGRVPSTVSVRNDKAPSFGPCPEAHLCHGFHTYGNRTALVSMLSALVRQLLRQIGSDRTVVIEQGWFRVTVGERDQEELDALLRDVTDLLPRLYTTSEPEALNGTCESGVREWDYRRHLAAMSSLLRVDANRESGRALRRRWADELGAFERYQLACHFDDISRETLIGVLEDPAATSTTIGYTVESLAYRHLGARSRAAMAPRLDAIGTKLAVSVAQDWIRAGAPLPDALLAHPEVAALERFDGSREQREFAGQTVDIEWGTEDASPRPVRVWVASPLPDDVFVEVRLADADDGSGRAPGDLRDVATKRRWKPDVRALVHGDVDEAIRRSVASEVVVVDGRVGLYAGIDGRFELSEEELVSRLADDAIAIVDAMPRTWDRDRRLRSIVENESAERDVRHEAMLTLVTYSRWTDATASALRAYRADDTFSVGQRATVGASIGDRAMVERALDDVGDKWWYLDDPVRQLVEHWPRDLIAESLWADYEQHGTRAAKLLGLMLCCFPDEPAARFIEPLPNPDGEDVSRVAVALSAANDMDVEPVLWSLVAHEEDRVALPALDVLGAAGTPRSIPALENVRQGATSSERTEAIDRALDTIRDRSPHMAGGGLAVVGTTTSGALSEARERGELGIRGDG